MKNLKGYCGKELIVKTWKNGFSLKCQNPDSIAKSRSVVIYAKAEPVKGVSHLCGGCVEDKKNE